MSATAADVHAGQAIYTRKVLSSYDFFVLGLSNRFLWKCPSRRILEFYEAHVSANHLDVGVGTGYFLDHCQFPATPRLALLDLNAECLSYTAQRLARYSPEIYRDNILDPSLSGIAPFDSIGLNYVLHCLPGAIHEKAIVFDNLQSLLKPKGVLFGSTILSSGVKRSRLASAQMAKYNESKIFSNANDSLEGLRQSLKRRFAAVTIEIRGCVALFSARRE